LFSIIHKHFYNQYDNVLSLPKEGSPHLHYSLRFVVETLLPMSLPSTSKLFLFNAAPPARLITYHHNFTHTHYTLHDTVNFMKQLITFVRVLHAVDKVHVLLCKFCSPIV